MSRRSPPSTPAPSLPSPLPPPPPSPPPPPFPLHQHRTSASATATAATFDYLPHHNHLSPPSSSSSSSDSLTLLEALSDLSLLDQASSSSSSASPPCSTPSPTSASPPTAAATTTASSAASPLLSPFHRRRRLSHRLSSTLCGGISPPPATSPPVSFAAPSSWTSRTPSSQTRASSPTPPTTVTTFASVSPRFRFKALSGDQQQHLGHGPQSSQQPVARRAKKPAPGLLSLPTELVEAIAGHLDRTDLLKFVHSASRVYHMFRSTQLQPFFRRRVLAECHAPTRPLDLFDHLVASRAIASQLAPHPMLLMLAPPRASHIVPAEVLSPNVPVGIDWFRAHLALDFLCVFCLRVPLAAEPLSSPSHPPSSLESLSSVSSDTLVVTSGAGTPSRRNRSTSSSAFDFLAAAAMASSIGSAGFVTFADNPPNDRRNAERTKSGEIHTPSLSTPHRTAAGMSCELPALLKKMRKGNGWWSLDTGLLNCDECLRRSYCSHCDSAKRECVGGASKASCLRNTACPACYNASFRNCTTCAEPLSSCPRCSLSYNDDAIPIVPPPARAPTGGIANFELTTSVTPAFGDLPVVPQFLADASATADMDEVWSSAWRAAVKGVHGGGAGGTYSAATLSRKKYFCSTRCRDVYVNGGL